MIVGKKKTPTLPGLARLVLLCVKIAHIQQSRIHLDVHSNKCNEK